MGDAKNIIIKPISHRDARKVVQRLHYSGKTVNNSQLHLGVFYNGKCEGAMQFGPSLDKRKIQGLVSDTGWNEFIELNRMAFSDVLPRNSESRAIGFAMRTIKKRYPHIKWVVSFADGAQCGDGTIYRASGFVLTGIKKNNQIWVAPDDNTFSRMSLTDGRSKQQQQQAQKICRTTVTKGKSITSSGGGSSMKQYIDAGFKPIEGFQLRYIYFIDRTAKENLTVPILPFSEIDKMGAGMYKGVKRSKQAMTGTTGTATGQNRSERSIKIKEVE